MNSDTSEGLAIKQHTMFRELLSIPHGSVRSGKIRGHIVAGFVQKAKEFGHHLYYTGSFIIKSE